MIQRSIRGIRLFAHIRVKKYDDNFSLIAVFIHSRKLYNNADD